MTNLFGDTGILFAPDLGDRLRALQKQPRTMRSEQLFHPNVYSMALLLKYVNGKIGRFEIKKDECFFQENVGINPIHPYGRVILVGNHIAQKFKEWDEMNVREIELTESEKELIKTLSK